MEKCELIKIMIIGDYLIFRSGLKRLLESENGFKVESEIGDLSTASVELKRAKPDVVIINSREAESSDFKTFSTEECNNTPILILTHSTEIRTHQKYLLLGAKGVVTKEQSPEILFKAIKQICVNDLWFERRVIMETISKLIEEKKDLPQKLPSQKYAALTEREWEVLTCLCQGMKNKIIAENLFITETTVRHHLNSIFEKLNVKNRLALATLAFKDGVVGIPSEN